MKTHPILITAIATVTAFGIFQQWRASHWKDESATLRQELAAARNAADRSSRSSDDRRVGPAGVVPAVEHRTEAPVFAFASEPAEKATESAAAADSTGFGAAIAVFAKTMESEEGRQMMKAETGREVRMQYGDLVRMLKLPPADSDQLLALIEEREHAVQAQEMKGLASGKLNKASIEKIEVDAEAVREAYNAKLTALLGPEGFARMEQYEDTIEDRMLLQTYDQQFGASGHPLQAQQREQLLQLVLEERAKFDATGESVDLSESAVLLDEGVAEREMKREEEFHQQVLRNAPKILNPDQVNALQQMFQETAATNRAMMKLGREFLRQGIGGTE